jgi:predicted amidophosphoribosyltransferase
MLGLAELFFPPCCLGCAQVVPARRFFCPQCSPMLERLPAPRCRLCSEPGEFPGLRCPRCSRRPPPFSRAFAPFLHHGPIARAIHQFKYEDHPELAPLLAHLLALEAASFLAGAPDLVCAIPLHRKRFHQRRFDQAQLLAGELARRTGRRCVPGALVRHRATERQVGLNESERDLNVAGAFRGQGAVGGRCARSTGSGVGPRLGPMSASDTLEGSCERVQWLGRHLRKQAR